MFSTQSDNNIPIWPYFWHHIFIYCLIGRAQIWHIGWRVNSLPLKLYFQQPWKRTLMKAFRNKKKMLVTPNSSFVILFYTCPVTNLHLWDMLILLSTDAFTLDWYQIFFVWLSLAPSYQSTIYLGVVPIKKKSTAHMFTCFHWISSSLSLHFFLGFLKQWIVVWKNKQQRECCQWFSWQDSMYDDCCIFSSISMFAIQILKIYITLYHTISNFNDPE